MELEKSQRQQELLQLKSYSPCDGSPYRKNHESRSSAEVDSKLGLASAPAVNGVSPDLSMNGTSSPCYDRASAKGELISRYLPISPDHENTPCAPDARQRQLNSSSTLPDYTRFSPAKIALRRHLNQDPTALSNQRGSGLHAYRLAQKENKPVFLVDLHFLMFSIDFTSFFASCDDSYVVKARLLKQNHSLCYY